MPRNLRNCLGPLYWRWSCSVRSTAALKKSREVVLEFWSFLWQGMMSSKNLKVFVKIWVCYQGDLDSTIITVHADMIHASLEHVLSCCLRKMFAAGETTSLYHSIPISHAFDVDVTYQVSANGLETVRVKWHVFKVLRNGLLRYILYTCPNLWCNSCSKCYGMDCSGTYFTHVQTCDVTRVQSATEWTASVYTSHMSKPVM